MTSVISLWCLGVRSVNVFNVDIKLSRHFFILNVAGSVKIEGGSASVPLTGPAEPSLHWPSWATCSLLVQSPGSGPSHDIENFAPSVHATARHLAPFPSESAVRVAGL